MHDCICIHSKPCAELSPPSPTAQARPPSRSRVVIQRRIARLACAALGLLEACPLSRQWARCHRAGAHQLLRSRADVLLLHHGCPSMPADVIKICTSVATLPAFRCVTETNGPDPSMPRPPSITPEPYSASLRPPHTRCNCRNTHASCPVAPTSTQEQVRRVLRKVCDSL